MLVTPDRSVGDEVSETLSPGWALIIAISIFGGVMTGIYINPPAGLIAGVGLAGGLRALIRR